MLEIIFRSILIEFIGAFTKWIFYYVKNSFQGNRIKSFKEIWSGRKEASDHDKLSTGLSNIFVGYLVLIILIGVGFLIDHLFY